VRFNYSFLDRLLSYSIFEINRAFHIGGDITIIPSFKVMYQFDNGVGEFANAKFKGRYKGI